MIKNLVFDMGGVVFLQDTDEAFRRFREAGLADTDQYMGAYGQKDFFMDIESGAIGEQEFCRSLARATGRDTVSWSEAQHCWLGFIREVPTDRLRSLTELRKKYRLYLLSNTNPFTMAYTRSTSFSADGRPISDYFDGIYCSYEMKCCKPNAEIFIKAMADGNMRPEETIFIDDSRKNTAAAEALGMEVLTIATNRDWRPQLREMLK